MADNIVQLNVRDLAALFNSTIRARAKARVCAAKVTGIVDATDLETTAQYEGRGQVTRKQKVTDKRGQGQPTSAARGTRSRSRSMVGS